MSLESEVARLANAMERVASIFENMQQSKPVVAGNTNAALGAEEQPAPKKNKKAPAAAAEEQAAPAYTYDQVMAALKKHSLTFGVKVTKPLMVKYGATEGAEQVKQIPADNYGKLMAEIEKAHQAASEELS